MKIKIIKILAANTLVALTVAVVITARPESAAVVVAVTNVAVKPLTVVQNEK